MSFHPLSSADSEGTAPTPRLARRDCYGTSVRRQDCALTPTTCQAATEHQQDISLLITISHFLPRGLT